MNVKDFIIKIIKKINIKKESNFIQNKIEKFFYYYNKF